MPAAVGAAAQAVAAAPTPGVPGLALARATLEIPQAHVLATTTKDAMSSSGARVILLGPSALRPESNIALNTPRRVTSAATLAAL